MPDYNLARTIRRFGPMLRPQAQRIGVIVLASLTASALAVLAPMPIKLVIDGVLGAATPAPLARLSPEAVVIALASAAAVIAALAAIFSALEKRISATAREEMTRALRLACLDRFLRLTPVCVGDDRQGELALRLIDDSQQVARLFTKTGPVIIRHGLVFVLALTAMAWVSLWLALLALVICTGLTLVVRLSAKPLAAAARAKRKQEGRVAASAQEMLRLLAFIQSSGSEPVMRERFDAINRAALSEGVRETVAAVRLEQAMQIANGLALALIVGAGGWLALRGAISAGDLAIAVLYLGQMLKPLEKINELASAITGATSRAGRLAELLDRPDALGRKGDHRVLADPVALEWRGASFAWPGGRPIAFGNLKIAPGTLVALSGPSGAGKSTLLALITRLIDPAEGELLLDGIAYRDWDVDTLRSHFAIAPQSPPLMAGTVRDWLALGDPLASDGQCYHALAAVSLEEAVREKGGLDSPLGEAGAGFSGGEQARLSLARSLLAKRPVLLLDEPLANIDARSAAIILRALECEKGHRTIIIISHQPLPHGLADMVIDLTPDTMAPRAVRFAAAEPMA